MITDAFDGSTPAIISPESFYGPMGDVCDVCTVTFSKRVFDRARLLFRAKRVGTLGGCDGKRGVYVFKREGRRIGLYLSHLGAACAGADLLEVRQILGAGKFVVFGSAGSLDSEKTAGGYIIPTAAYRDEGMSYHYAPPADYIELKNAGTVAEIFSKLGKPYVTGRTWTTDAIYRETVGNMEKRRGEGCVCVEMELAGLQAVCDFHSLELYAFLDAGDRLDGEEYDRSGLKRANHGFEKFEIAVEIAKRV